jgi:protein-tyrosine-phosphatase
VPTVSAGVSGFGGRVRPHPDMNDGFSLLFLCAGNRFRSPLAAAFVRRLTIGLPVTVTSAGTLPVGDATALPEARELGAWCGVDLSTHRARQLAPEHLLGLDLLVGFEQFHVRHAVVDGGVDRSLAFTLSELVGLLGELGPAPGGPLAALARERVRLADELRDDRLSASGDVPDPFGGPKKGYRSAAVRVQGLSVALVERLFGRTGRGGLVLLD